VPPVVLPSFIKPFFREEFPSSSGANPKQNVIVLQNSFFRRIPVNDYRLTQPTGTKVGIKCLINNGITTGTQGIYS